jgi:hypothetical protein
MWLKGLADADPSVRDASRLGLMRLPADELPVLHDEVAGMGAIEPEQSQALPDIVRHVYLKGVEYESLPNGFLGLSWPPVVAPALAPPLDQAGVVVEGRLPGFEAYGVLETGDVILSMGDPPAPIRTHADLTEPVKLLPPGTVLSMTIRRGAVEMKVQLTLASRPRVADEADQAGEPAKVDQWQQSRLAAAQEYWDQQFAPLMSRDVPVAGR